MDFDNRYIEIPILIFSFVLFLLFLLTIRKNGENIFFSMRSSNLMQITNLSIFLSILVYGLSDFFYEELKIDKYKILSYIPSLYFLFQIITFLSLILRYHRLYISCKINSLSRDELLQFKFFEAKPYHYEYFYVRIMALFILVIIISSCVFYYTTESDIMKSFEILNNHKTIDGIDSIDNQLYFWMTLSFIETIVFITYALLIVKIHLSPNINILKEIILLTITNYLYFLSIGFSVLEPLKNRSKTIKLYFPFLYNLLVLFVTLGLPFLWGRYNDTVINYDLPGELTSSLYLFLTKEKCFDLFHNYLYYKGNEKRKAIFYLDMLINIFKYRMLVFTNQSPGLILEEMDNIERMYLRSIDTPKYFEGNLVNEMTNACRNTREHPKLNTFDPITNVIYEYLDGEFKNFKKTEEFDALRNDLREETYVRCKLVNYGLIRN